MSLVFSPSPQEQTIIESNHTWVVSITNLVLSCSIGVFDHEKQTKQPVRFSLKCYAKIPLPLGENFAYICYHDLIDQIESLVNSGHILLVESLAESICNLCFQHDSVYRVWVCVEKIDAFPNACVGVEVDRFR